MDIEERKTTDFIINGLLLQLPLDFKKITVWSNSKSCESYPSHFQNIFCTLTYALKYNLMAWRHT